MADAVALHSFPFRRAFVDGLAVGLAGEWTDGRKVKELCALVHSFISPSSLDSHFS